MPQLDKFYLELLKVGFIVLRQAIESGDETWTNMELEFLHNIPSLVGEANIERHRYFWREEQKHYQQQMNTLPNEMAKSRMRTYYLPILLEMQPEMEQLLTGRT